jgi:putative NIF3 family GTP cyclohydrolase 1 type 2
MRSASAAGLNMVVTHEPTFYSHPDTIDQIKDDEIYRFKLDFIETNKMVSFHFHDHWHGHRPDGIATGMARELGWEKNADAQNPRLFSFSPAPLARLAQEIESKLKIRTMRVVGDPDLTVKRAIASWGNVSQFPGIPLLARSDIDVLIIGRDPRVGARRVCSGHDLVRQEKGADRPGPRGFRTVGYEVLRGMAEDLHQRSAN